MNLYLEMSRKLEQDIHEAEAHLAKLTAALEAMKPLITVDVPNQRALKYEPRPSTAPLVEEVEPVVPSVPKPKTKRRLQAPAAPEGETTDEAGGNVEPSVTAQKPKPARKRQATEDSAKVGSGAPSGGPAVPATSRDFFASILGARARTMPELVARAMAKLAAPEGSEAVIANRLSAWLYPAIKAGLAEQSGVKGKLKAYRLVGSKG